MGINLKNIKRWALMLSGKSVYHVKQDVGNMMKKNSCLGYYNDLTQKVIQGDRTLDGNGLPVLMHSDGMKVHMPTMIFQYGLGAFDLWLMSNRTENSYLNMAIKCADWALENQMQSGAWNTFFYVYPEHPFSAMPQGEGASLLIRIYTIKKEQKYLEAAKKAIDFMLLDVRKGGVASYDDGLILLEYTGSSAILNGWIFALWGLYDLCFFEDGAKYREALELTLSTLKRYLPQFDNGYWSLYNLDGMITSPFYHDLHIAQLDAMTMLFEDDVYKKYSVIFGCYRKRSVNRCRAFLVKAFQKIKE